MKKMLINFIFHAINITLLIYNMKRRYQFLALLVVVLMACEKEEPPKPEESNPFIVILDASFDLDQCRWILNGALGGYLEGEEPDSYGFVYSYENTLPSLEDEVLEIDESFENSAVFSTFSDDLVFGETLYVRLFANSNGEIYYGDKVTNQITYGLLDPFHYNQPHLEECGSSSAQISFSFSQCMPQGAEYGIVYFNRDGFIDLDHIKIAKGFIDGSYPVEIVSNIVEDAQGRSNYFIYVETDAGSTITRSIDYTIPSESGDHEVSFLGDFPGILRAESTAFAFDGKGYICGGYQENRAGLLDDLWEYSPASDSWAQKASFPGGPRALMTSFVTDNYAYVGTGGNELGTDAYGNPEFYRYDPLSDKWDQIADFPIAGIAGLSFSLEGVGYVGALLISENNISQQFFKYEEGVNEWQEVASFPISFSHARHSAVAHQGLGLVAVSAPVGNQYYTYLPELDAWNKQSVKVPIDGNDGLLFEKNNKIYQVAGRGSLVFTEVDVMEGSYSTACIDSSTWRTEAVGFNIDGTFYVSTGIDESNRTEEAQDLKKSVYKIDID